MTSSGQRVYCNRNLLEAVCQGEKTESAGTVQKTLRVLVAVLALPILSAAAQEDPGPELAAYMRECPHFSGMDRYHCMAAILHIHETLRGTEGAQAKPSFSASVLRLLTGRLSDKGANASTNLFVGFDKTSYRRPGGTAWPAHPPHSFTVACRDAGYRVSLFMHGVPVEEKDGGTIVQFKVDDTPTQTLFLDADSLNGFSGRLSGTGDRVDALIEAIRGGEELEVWVSVPRNNRIREAFFRGDILRDTRSGREARLAFSIAGAADSLASADLGCGTTLIP